MRDVADDFVRFIRLVQIGEKWECWPWTGNKPDGRYGHFSVGAKAIKAHRWIYALLHGEVGDDLVIRHKCDNPACVNPAHLESGTQAENIRDKYERGRAPNRQGDKHPLAKLDDQKVLEIRRRASLGETHHSLAAEFGVRRGQIGKIVQRINWSHI